MASTRGHAAASGMVEALEGRTLLAASPAAAEPQAVEIPNLPLGLLVTIRGHVPGQAMAGQRAKVNQFVKVLNLSGARLSGPVTVKLYLSRDTNLDRGDVQVAAVTRRLGLEQLGSREVSLKVAAVPASADGTYRLLAAASSPAFASPAAAAFSPIAITPAAIDLSASFREPLPARLTPGEQATVRLQVRQEAGNVPFKGTVSVAVYASASAGATASGSPLATVPLKVSLRPGTSRQYRLKFHVPDDFATTPVFLTAVINPGASLGDRVASNNTAVTTSTIPVG